MRIISTIGLIVLLCAPLATPIASAHGDETSWEVPAGRYVVDVGYDAEQFVAGGSTRFDFNLKTASSETGAAVPFDEVWVRIKGANATLLATGVRKQSLGPTTLLYMFVAPGTYSLETSFRDADGHEIAAASFPISVVAGEKDTTQSSWMSYLALGALLGVVLASLFSTARKLRRS